MEVEITVLEKNNLDESYFQLTVQYYDLQKLQKQMILAWNRHVSVHFLIINHNI